jgi:hypothetical protein
MTPWQSSTLLEAEADAVRARHDLALFAAWHAEAFARTKKLPDLSQVLARHAPKHAAPDLAAKIKTVMSMFPRQTRTDSE